MDGIAPIELEGQREWTVKAPFITSDHDQPMDLPDAVSSEYFNDVASCRSQFSSCASLASAMQSCLFFGLLRAFLAEFLDRHVYHEDFIANGFIDLGQSSGTEYFIAWERNFNRASQRKRRQARRSAKEAIRYALSKCAILEEAADMLPSEDSNLCDVEAVALSIKLLAEMLLAMLDESFSKPINIWTPAAVKVAKRSMRAVIYALFPYLNWRRPAYVKDYVNLMKADQLRKTAYGHQSSQTALQAGDEDGGPAARLMLRIFERNGWCPFRALQLCRRFDYLVLNSLAVLSRPNVVDEDHSGCLGARRCTAHDVVGLDQGAEYVFSHDWKQCNGSCDFVSVPYDRLVEIMRAGGKPLISLSNDGNDLDMRVEPCTPYITYTAVSHVWSDGRGNPDRNALPRCQLVWLRDRIKETYHAQFNPYYVDDGTYSTIFNSHMEFEMSKILRPGRPVTSIHKDRTYFWMDTLCIPVQSELRFQAIKQITPIFVGAYNCLVLDKGLESADPAVTGPPCGAIFARRILRSTWMERGWTLQEGSLSQSCVTQMMGKPYEMEMALRHPLDQSNLVDAPLERAVSLNHRSLILHLRKELLEHRRLIMMQTWYWRAQRVNKMLRVPTFVWIWNSLIHRSTTNPQDGVLIFASLLDVDVYQLRHVPRNERLMKVIQGCDEIPLSLLYNTGQKALVDQRQHLNWMPADVIGDDLVTGPVLRKLRVDSSYGLVVYSLEHGFREEHDFLALASAPGQQMFSPGEPGVLHIMIDAEYTSRHASLEYFVEMQRTSLPIGNLQDTHTLASSQQFELFIVIDLVSGSNSLRSIAGRGALFFIDSRGQAQWTVRYEAPVIARTPEQWLRYRKAPEVIHPSVLMLRVSRRRQVVMKYGKCTTLMVFTFP